MTLMVKALEFNNTNTNRLRRWFTQWLPVSLVVLAWGHAIGYLVQQLLMLWCNSEPPLASNLIHVHLTVHGGILILFFLVGVAPCKTLIAEAASNHHSLSH